VIPQRNSDELLSWVERSFGYVFLQPALCYAALTHRSAGADHNERLEFLGDSLLNCSVARLLFDAHPEADEGVLSRLRATLVSGDTLAQIAQQLGLGEYLRLGPGELKSGGFRRASILADALEAILGAMLLDSGFDAAAAAVKRIMDSRMSVLPTAGLLKDPKTRLQEALQAGGLALPVYTLTAVAGEPHAQSFTVTCEVPIFELAAVGEGGSRRRAEQLAAAKLLELLPPELQPPGERPAGGRPADSHAEDDRSPAVRKPT
jgi:ribonuclease III